MKKFFIPIIALCLTFSLTGCDDYLDYKPTAVIDEDKAFQDPEGMVTSAYAMLGDCWYTYPFNLWPYGDLASDDCLKGGSGTTDTDYHQVEVFSTLTPTLGHLDELWYRLYCAISRCNRAILSLNEYGNSKLGEATTKQRLAEVKFLRAHFYYKLFTVFNKIPWIDEEVYKNGTQEQTSNDALTHEQLWDKIIGDFQYAYDNLPEQTTDGGGRANKVAAAAYLAKCYLDRAWGDGYEETTGVNFINKDYMQKVVDYTDVVVRSGKYGYLEDYGDIFLPDYNNSKESIFSIQASDYKDDHTTFGRANWSNTLSIWNINSFAEYFMQIFTKYEKDYTLTKANSRTPNTYGYYTDLKCVPQRSKGETYNYPWQAFAMNEYMLRYTQTMLDRAEALIELDRLSDARDIINAIRQRAANSISKHIEYAADQCQISPYPESYFATKEKARQCLRWERRLEMGQEHERFFDLRRWGLLSSTLNAYFKKEAKDSYDGQTYAQYYKDAHFTKEKNEYMPIPYNQMFYIPGLYKQNKGY